MATPPRSRASRQARGGRRSPARATNSPTDLHAAILAARDHWKIDLHPRRDQPWRFRRDLDHHRARPRQRAGAARPAMLDATFERYWRDSAARRGHGGLEGLHAVRNARDRQLRAARLARPDRRSDRLLHEGPPPGRLEPVGRSGRPRPRAKSASSATCRTPGSRPISSAARSTCSPGTGATTARSCSAAGCRPTGWRARDRRSRGWRRPMACSTSRCAARGDA